jgi:hypothetical protein
MSSRSGIILQHNGCLTKNDCCKIFKDEMGFYISVKYLFLYFNEIGNASGEYLEKNFSWKDLKDFFEANGIATQLELARMITNVSDQGPYIQKNIMPKIRQFIDRSDSC